MNRAGKKAQAGDDASASASLVSTSSPESALSHDPYLALRYREFRLLFIGRFIATMGEQMVNVAIGWELYNRTGSALVLGFVGLVQVLPVLVLSLPAGHLADKFNRKRIVIVTQLVLAVGALGLTWLSYTQGSLLLIYACLLLMGGAMAYGDPASSALLSETVPERLYANASTWSSSSWQLAAVLGPALGGFVIAFDSSTALVYALDAGAILIFVALLTQLSGKQQGALAGERMTLRSLLEGVTFLKSTQVLLAAITLDMFAVLLGGATTLLPIFAKDILHVGATGLGWLRAAPSIGAVCMALSIAHLPPFRKAGKVLLWAVAGFGAATIVFGLSHSFWLSLLALFLLGGFDNISVVIRSTLLLTRTPDAMRGRTSSINNIFIATSNQLGGFESGLAAQVFGPILAVAGGGVGTLIVVLCVALLWPEMRRLGSLSEG